MSALPLLRQELRDRSSWPGWEQHMAGAAGISVPHLRNIKHGRARITASSAERILAAIRSEELNIADRIEAELNGHWGRGK